MPLFKDWVTGRDAVTVADADLIPIIDADADTSKKIAWSAVKTALTTVFDGQYASAGDTETIVITAGDMLSSAGAAAVGTLPTNRAAGMLFDATSGERVSVFLYIPASWATMSVTWVWANAGAGSGDVVWLVYGGTAVAGTDLATLPTLTTGQSTASTSGVVCHTSTSAVVVPNPGGIHQISPGRNSAAGGDTLANDAVLYAVILGKES